MLESNTMPIADITAFRDRPEEWVDRNSRRIWRQDQIKHEYWNQQAPAFKQSKNRAWVLKACYWQWQMSSQSDFLPIPHKDSAGKAVHSQRCPMITLWQRYAMPCCAVLCYATLHNTADVFAGAQVLSTRQQIPQSWCLPYNQ